MHQYFASQITIFCYFFVDAFQMYDIHRTGGITKDNITHVRT